MYTRVAEFVEEWKRESASTLKVLKVLTDASLPTMIDDESRSLARLGWHLVMLAGGTGGMLGLEVGGPARGTAAPTSAAEIATAYERVANAVAEQAAAKLTDAGLAEEIPYFGGRMLPRARIMGSLILHQCHHRGQITVLVRQAGLVPPGIYGPTREEEAARAK
jgi:uncharacterized damage-inducible protein DinB